MTAPGSSVAPLPLPSATSLRMVLVVTALVVSGLFVGTGLFNALDDNWTTAVLGCFSTNPVDVASQLHCQAPAERQRATVAVGAAIMLVLLACVVIAVAPTVLRRRKQLKPADQRYARARQTVSALAADDRMRAPELLIGPFTMSEPFCLGRPGDYRIALPRKLALVGNPPLFEALVRHELAHIAHHDVALSWLARSLWYVLAPLLVLPILVTFVGGEPLLALDIVWRSVVLLVVVLLVVRALLRAREFDADVRAARVATVRQVLDVELARRPAPTRQWKAVLAWHPTAASRRAVLADPASAAALGWIDGLTLGFLAALALPIITGIAAAALLDKLNAGLVSLIGALVVGPLFGATVGLGLWRHALVAPPTSRDSTAPLALGALAGGVFGGLAGLAGVGLGMPEPPIGVPLALAGTTAIVGGLGALWVRGRQVRQSAVGPAAAAFGAVAATALLWAAQEAQLGGVQVGWALVAAWLTTAGTLVYPAIAAVVLAVAAASAARPRWHLRTPTVVGGAPARVVERPRRDALVVGLCAGVGGGLGLVGYRAVVGAATGDDDLVQRFFAAVFGIALVGALAMALLGLARGVAGIGAGLIAGPVAILTAGALYLANNTRLGGNSLPELWAVFGAAVPAGLLLSAVFGLAGLVGTPRLRSTALVAVLAVVVGALATVGVVAERAVVVPAASDVVPGADPGQPVDPNQPALQPAVPRGLYLVVVAKPILDGRVAEADALATLKSGRPTNAAAAALVRSEVLPRANELLRLAQSFRFDDPAVEAVHQHALDGAGLHIEAFTLLAAALDANDRPMFEQANRLIARGDAEWEAWATAAQTL